METGQLNCAERIWAEVKDRAEYIKGLMDRQDDEAYQELAELPLGIDTKQVTTITLSYGGPADYLHITHDKGEVLRVVYRFSDWFDTATIELDESNELWDYAEFMIGHGALDYI